MEKNWRGRFRSGGVFTQSNNGKLTRFERQFGSDTVDVMPSSTELLILLFSFVSVCVIATLPTGKCAVSAPKYNVSHDPCKLPLARANSKKCRFVFDPHYWMHVLACITCTTALRVFNLHMGLLREHGMSAYVNHRFLCILVHR